MISELTEIDMPQLCNDDPKKNKNYYDTLPTPRFEVFFTYDKDGQTGGYCNVDKVKSFLESDTDKLLSDFLLENSDTERTLLKVSTCLIGVEYDTGGWWKNNDGKLLYGYMRDDCEALNTMSEPQAQAFQNTCQNYQEIVRRQAEELEVLRKKLIENMELMITMDHSNDDVENTLIDKMNDYFLGEINSRIVGEKEIEFKTKDNLLISCIKTACDNSEYVVKCKCLCEAHRSVWVELSE